MTHHPEMPTRYAASYLIKLSVSAFHAEPTSDCVLADDTRLPHKETEDQIYSLRARFAAKVPPGGSMFVYPVDRAAVLQIYTRALDMITPENHTRLFSEVKCKVATALGVCSAGPEDFVFSSHGALLPPLEPQYARPRIEYEDDVHGHAASARLKDWRAEGWPWDYPVAAIERERKRGLASATYENKGRVGYGVLKMRADGWAEEDWGSVVGCRETKRAGNGRRNQGDAMVCDA